GYTASSVSPPFSTNPTLVRSAANPTTNEYCGWRWNASGATWQILGGPNGLAGGLAQNVGLPITPSPMGYGSSGSSSTRGGTFIEPNAVSPDGRFVVGLAYVGSYSGSAGTTISNNTFQWRPYVWDATANAGAGGFTILPTPFRTSSNTWRRRTGN